MQRPKPIPPLPEDCCGQGCNPCVNDIYDEELKLWENESSQVIGIQTGQSESLQNKMFFKIISRDTYTAFILKEVIPVTDDTSIYRFALPFPNACLLDGKNIGQHLIIRLTLLKITECGCQGESKDGSITRQYTILSSPSTRGHFDIMIKLYNIGQASNIIQKWKVGDTAEFRGPFGEFGKIFMDPSNNGSVQLQDRSHIVMLAAGTGIAPMIQVIKYILDDESDTRLHLLYSCRTLSDILLKNEIKKFAEFWNFKVTYFITREEKENESVLKLQHYYATVIEQRINKEFLSEYLNSTSIGPESSKVLFLVCGTKSFEIETLDNLKDIGVIKTCIHKF